jgi:hypothetical protein
LQTSASGSHAQENRVRLNIAEYYARPGSFDISLEKKARALRYGAILTDMYGPVEFLARQYIMSGDPERSCRGWDRLPVVESCRA